jgi:hypothetical protein
MPVLSVQSESLTDDASRLVPPMAARLSDSTDLGRSSLPTSGCNYSYF